MSSGLDPFVDGHGVASYFTTPTLKQRIDLVRHLIEFGRQIIVLTGPPGSGKSTLLDQITANEGRPWQVVRMTAGPKLNGDTLIERLLEDLDIGRGEPATLGAIRDAIAGASADGQTTILAIDDADALPADTASCLAALAHVSNPDAELKVLLTADSGESAIINQLQIETEQHALLHVVEVPRLSDEQTQEMLQHRWRAAYGDEPFPFSDIEMAQIYQQAAGLPGKAIVLARQVQIMSGGPASTERDPARRLLIGGLIAIAVLVVIALINGTTVSKPEPALVELDLPEEIIAAAAPLEAPIEPMISPREPVTMPAAPVPAETEITLPPTPPRESPPPPEPPPEPAPEPASEAQAGTPAKAMPPPSAAAAPSPAVQPAAPAKPPAPARREVEQPARTPPKADKPRPAAAKPPYSLAWLKSQPKSGYVLQLFGVRDRAAAENFVRSRKLTGESVVHTTQHAGGPWYVVLWGHYPDRSAAQAAIGDLPVKLAGTSPWARPIKSLE